MGKFCDAAGMGFAFCPDPWVLAGVFAAWHPVRDPAGDLDVPDSRDFAIATWNSAPDQRNRSEPSDGIAWKHRRIFGTIVRIEECEADNATTPFRIEVSVGIPFLAEGHGPRIKSHLYALVRAYSPDAAITDHVPLLIGDAIQGIVSANYGGPGKAQLGGWRLDKADDWRLDF